MAVYYLVIISVAICGLLAQKTNTNSINKNKALANSASKYENHYGFFYILLIFIFIFVGGFRYYIGTDFGAYYKTYGLSWNEVMNSFSELDEPGLKLVAFLSRTIWDDGVSVIFISNLIITLLVFHGISKFDEKNDVTLMLLIYILIAGWTFSFNGVRQAFAASIIFAFSKVDKKNRIIKYLLICFIAFLFHKSALMMFPVLLLSSRRVDKKQFMILLVSAVIIPVLFDYAFDFMGTDLTNEEALTYIERGINPIRVVVSFAPLLLLILLKDKKTFFEKNSFVVNLTIFNAVLTITTMNSAYLNRFTKYTSMFLMAYYPVVFKKLTPNNRIIITMIVLLFYFLFFRYELTNGVDKVIWQWSFSHFGEY